MRHETRNHNDIYWSVTHDLIGDTNLTTDRVTCLGKAKSLIGPVPLNGHSLLLSVGLDRIKPHLRGNIRLITGLMPTSASGCAP